MPFSHRNLLGEFSICPVYMGINLNIRMYEYGFGDLPRVYGDEPRQPTKCKPSVLSAPWARGCISIGEKSTYEN